MFCTRWSFAIDLFSNVLFQTFHYFWKLDLLSCWFHCVEMFYIEFRMRETFTVIPRFEFYWLKHRINLDLKTKSWDYIKSEYNHESYLHCVKSVQIRSYFWSIFSCIRPEYRKIRTRNNLHTFYAVLKYRWNQLIDALPKWYKDRILNCRGD